MTEEILTRGNEIQAKIIQIRKIKAGIANMCDERGMTVTGWSKGGLAYAIAEIFMGFNASVQINLPAIVAMVKEQLLQLLDKEETRMALELEGLK
jgi:hypothetical protein